MIRSDFNQGWQFQKAGADRWQAVTLLHDAMIHETRDPQSPGGSAVGFFTGGVYVYEKTFVAPVEWREKCVTFEFEGIYKNSKVYLNGQEAGGWPYGYSRFFVQADPSCDTVENTLASSLTIRNCRTAVGSRAAVSIAPRCL